MLIFIGAYEWLVVFTQWTISCIIGAKFSYIFVSTVVCYAAVCQHVGICPVRVIYFWFCV